MCRRKRRKYRECNRKNGMHIERVTQWTTEYFKQRIELLFYFRIIFFILTFFFFRQLKGPSMSFRHIEKNTFDIQHKN